ncbi:MAG: hypothetical protein LBJ63_08615 [Prevotellaceae bacterium]|jgi:hypothetical protein|nr:hypothetical protein [Prevotellaceae bacterium]
MKELNKQYPVMSRDGIIMILIADLNRRYGAIKNPMNDEIAGASASLPETPATCGRLSHSVGNVPATLRQAFILGVKHSCNPAAGFHTRCETMPQ